MTDTLIQKLMQLISNSMNYRINPITLVIEPISDFKHLKFKINISLRSPHCDQKIIKTEKKREKRNFSN